MSRIYFCNDWCAGRLQAFFIPVCLRSMPGEDGKDKKRLRGFNRRNGALFLRLTPTVRNRSDGKARSAGNRARALSGTKITFLRAGAGVIGQPETRRGSPTAEGAVPIIGRDGAPSIRHGQRGRPRSVTFAPGRTQLGHRSFRAIFSGRGRRPGPGGQRQISS